MSGSGPIYEYQRELTAKLEQALRERDEARAELAFIAAEYEKANASNLTRDALAMQNAALKADVERVMHERDEAERELVLHKNERLRLRAEDLRLQREVKRLKVVLDTVRAARSLLGQLRDHVSDHACEELLSLLSDEPLDVDGNLYLTPSQAAYQRGAEAMREATAQLIQSTWTAETPEQVRALPVPEGE